MAFCSNCGIQVQDNANFCPGCGTKLVSQTDLGTPANEKQTKVVSGKKVSDWNLLSKVNVILGLVIVESIAALGALPLIEHGYYAPSFNINNYGTSGHAVYHMGHPHSLWQDYWPATIVFGVMVIAVILRITWNRPILTRFISVLLVSGLSAFTIMSIQFYVQ